MKAVIPAAGFGTRLLPATKSQPKEMLPVYDKPTIQYVMEEAIASGIDDILIVTGRNKRSIEDHFDKSYELEYSLQKSGKDRVLKQVRKITDLADVCYVRQKDMNGLGDAILCAQKHIEDEPFAVLYGDDVIVGEEPACAQLLKAYEKFEKIIVGVKKVPEDEIFKYSSLKVKRINDGIFECVDMIEKPKASQVMSCYSIQGRCILTPDIFDVISETSPGKGGEVQLTDAIRTIARKSGVLAVEYSGKRYDIGSKIGVLEACVEMGLVHPEIGEEFKSYLKNLIRVC